MRTNIVIDDDLIKEGLIITGFKTKKDLVSYALKELIRRKKMYEILNLKGKIDWNANLGEMRENRKW
jgi:Arc/MetJ family transcription regulator